MRGKQTIFLVLAIACIASASLSEELTEEGFSQKSLYDGFRQFAKEHESHIETILVGGFSSVFEDPSLMTEFAKKITSFTQEQKDDILISCQKGGHPNFFKFLSTTNGQVGLNGSETITLEGREDECFESRLDTNGREDKFIDLSNDEVHPGDFLIITRMDGLDQIIQWGTGTRSGHSVTLLEIEGEMYAVESQDAWYWPKKNIQRNKWSEWKQYAQNAGFKVSLLPLRPDIRAKFNNTAAYEWFKKVENVHYGYHNFLFGFFDSVSSNLPAVVDINFVYTVFTLIEKFLPSVSKSLIGEAVNKRLNATNLNLAEAYEVMFQRNLTIAQVFAIPEQDSWVYSDGPSMVCSSFVAAIWKAGGLYDGIDNIQATEFTPRDVYQTNFFDLKYKKPTKCAHDGLPYCQIMGKFRMDIIDDGYSSLDPYPNMFQTCPSMAPLCERTPGC